MDTDELFFKNLLDIRQLSQTKIEACAMFGYDIPKAMLFSCFGKAIALHFESFTEMEKKTIFFAIEEGLYSDDEKLVAYIATCLLQAFYKKASRNKMRWEDLALYLGVKSRKYIDGWIA